MKIVINTDFGGFGLSEMGEELYTELSGEKYTYDVERTDPFIVRVVERLGNAANGRYSELKVVEIPDDVSWYIHDNDGVETIHEDHRRWS